MNAMNFGDLFVPALMVFILCYGLVKKVDIVNVFCEGATENLKIAVGLIPMLILLMTAVGPLFWAFRKSAYPLP